MTESTPPKSPLGSIGYIIGGGIIGILVLLVAINVFKPAVKRICHSILQEETSAKQARGERVVSVEAIVTTLGTMTRRINTVGKLRANEAVTIKSEVSGVIKEIHFKEGAQVAKGDLLISFKDDEIIAELHQGEAEVIEAQAAFDRYSTLKERGAGSSKQFDEARAKLAIAKAHVERANAKLLGTQIQAPFEGKIGLIEQSPGAYVQANTDLVTLVDVDPMKLDCKIPEKYLLDIGEGQSAEVRIDTLPAEKFIATVDAIDSRIDTTSHSVAIRASIPNKNGKLKAGQFANISLIIGEKGNTLAVPDAAIGRDGDREFVWVVIKGKAARAPIITSTRENDKVEVVTGLREGLLVVTAGQHNLSEGAPVKILNMKEEEIAAIEKKLMEKLAAAKKKAAAEAEEAKPGEESKPIEPTSKDPAAAPAEAPAALEAEKPAAAPSEPIKPVTPTEDVPAAAPANVAPVAPAPEPTPAEPAAQVEEPKPVVPEPSQEPTTAESKPTGASQPAEPEAPAPAKEPELPSQPTQDETGPKDQPTISDPDLKKD